MSSTSGTRAGRKREIQSGKRNLPGNAGERGGNGTKVRWVNSGRLDWPIKCDQSRPFRDIHHLSSTPVLINEPRRRYRFHHERESISNRTELVSDLVPPAMDGLSVPLPSNACAPWNSGAWDSRFEIRDPEKNSRFEIRGQQRNNHRDPGANHEKRPHSLPRCLSAHRCELLHRCSPLSPLSSCGNRARAAPISYRQSLLQISKRSDSCIRHPQHSIPCQRQSQHRFYFSATRD